MSDKAKQLFEGLRNVKETVQQALPGLGNIGADVKAEFKRVNTQAAMELASALFRGDAFVPYGPGQYTPDHENEQEQEQEREMGRGR